MSLKTWLADFLETLGDAAEKELNKPQGKDHVAMNFSLITNEVTHDHMTHPERIEELEEGR